jgi:hypothetical protein
MARRSIGGKMTLKKQDHPANAGVWGGNWTSFISERRIPETEKYFVLATWEEAGMGHSCRFPVRATFEEAAVQFVEDAQKDRLFAQAEGDIEFQVLLLSDVPSRQIEYLLRTDLEDIVN